MLKDRLKRILVSHPLGSLFIYKLSRLVYHDAMIKLSNERRNISIFNSSILSQPIPYGPLEIVIDNNKYGHAYTLRKYCNIDKPLNAYIEHGLFWGGMIHADQYFWHVPTYITFSTNRKNDILSKGINKKILTIGPYIHYASSLLCKDELAELKSILGRVLLVFPSHSIPHINAHFNIDSFVDEIARVAKDFDTVFISLYYLDALKKENIELYQKKGWHIVTSGHKHDQHFLNRQRTIIELADATLSNEIGTHVGYCIYLNKPHYYFHQEVTRNSPSRKELVRELSLYSQDEIERRNAEKEEVARAFAFNHSFAITPEQRQVVNKYWGSSSVMDANSMREALLKA